MPKPTPTPHARHALDIISSGGNLQTLSAGGVQRAAEGVCAEIILPDPKPLTRGQMYSSATALNTSPSANTPLHDNTFSATRANTRQSTMLWAPGVSGQRLLADMLFLSRAGLGEAIKIRLPQSANSSTVKPRLDVSGQRTDSDPCKTAVAPTKNTISNPMDRCYLAKPAVTTTPKVTSRITSLAASTSQWFGDFVACRPMPTTSIADSPESGRLKALLSPHYLPTYNNLVAALKLELANQNDLLYASKYIATPGNIEPSVIEVLRNRHQPGTPLRDKFDRYLSEGSIQLAYESKRDPQLKKLKELLGGSPSENGLADALRMTLLTEDALIYVQDRLASPAWKTTVQSFKVNPRFVTYIDKLEAYVEEGTCHANERIMANRRSRFATTESTADSTAGNTTLVRFPSFNTWDSGRVSRTDTSATNLTERRMVPNVARKTLNALPVGRSEVNERGDYSLLFDRAEVAAFMQNRIPMAKLVNYALKMTCDRGHTIIAHVNSVGESNGCIRLTFKDQPIAPEHLQSCEFINRADLWRHAEQEQTLRFAN